MSDNLQVAEISKSNKITLTIGIALRKNKYTYEYLYIYSSKMIVINVQFY